MILRACLLIPVLLLCVVAPAIAQSTTKPWQSQVAIDLDKAASDLVKFSKSNQEMVDIHMPRTTEGDSRLLWLNDLSTDDVHAYALFCQRDETVYRDLISIWFDSRNPGPIPEMSQQEVVDKAGEVIHYYHDWLSKAPGSQEAIALKTLPANISALKSIYCWNAFFVLNDVVNFSGGWTVSHPRAFRKIDPAVRRKIYDRFQSWYAANNGSLIWDSANTQFTAPDGQPFPQMYVNFDDLMGVSNVEEPSTRPEPPSGLNSVP